MQTSADLIETFTCLLKTYQNITQTKIFPNLFKATKPIKINPNLHVSYIYLSKPIQTLTYPKQPYQNLSKPKETFLNQS
jgi:hypothetical protein